VSETVQVEDMAICDSGSVGYLPRLCAGRLSLRAKPANICFTACFTRI